MIYEKTEQKKAQIEPWKLQILMRETLGRCPKTCKGLVPWPIFGLCPNPSSPEGRKRVQLPLFCWERIIRELYVKRLSRHILARCAPVFHGSPDNNSAHYEVCPDWRFLIVCWPRKISICHLPGMLSAPSSISTRFRTLPLNCLCGRRKL